MDLVEKEKKNDYSRFFVTKVFFRFILLKKLFTSGAQLIVRVRLSSLRMGIKRMDGPLPWFT